MTDQQYGEHGQCEATAKSTGERCKKSAIGPHGKCDIHGGRSKKGTDHPNFVDGKTSKYFKSKLSDRQREVYDEMAEALSDPEDALKILRKVATRMILVGEHTNDPAMVREGRQLLSEFNIVDNSDKVEVDAHVEGDQTLSLDEPTRDVVREVLNRRRQGGDDE